MIGLVEAGVGASCAAVAAVVTWAAQLPAWRRASQKLANEKARVQALQNGQREALLSRESELHAEFKKHLDKAKQEAAGHWRYAQKLLGEVDHLLEQRLPTVIQEIHGVPVQYKLGLRDPSLEGSEIAGYLASVEELLLSTAADVRRRVEDSARAGVRVATEEVQASLTRAQRIIDNALDDEDGQGPGPSGTDPRTLAQIDHVVTLAVHAAKRLRILVGSWPGVQRANCSISEIIDGARGNIQLVDAVEYASRPETADVQVEGLIVEPVIVALTELLDNATTYSGQKVSTYVEKVTAGIRLTVEDSGLGMSPLALERAERALASGGADVTALAEPFNLGFLVIGRLVHDYKLRVGLSLSASGGVRARLLIPEERLVADSGEGSPGRRAGAAQPHPAKLQRVPAPMQSAAVTERAPAAVTPGSGPREEPSHPAHAHDAPAAMPQTAEAAASPATVHGLPKRQPRRPVQQGPAPRQQAISDPEAYTEGIAQLGRIWADELDSDHTKEG
ncbi:hypothetical protein OG800_50460 (plasmid) [Streptomyces sp. NBC_00445]|uniref:hypothetical protein n=1 Tax=Streptomyces sp. NBC_00445 TaxID=2975745 RepID=UPI002E1D5AA5